MTCTDLEGAVSDPNMPILLYIDDTIYIKSMFTPFPFEILYFCMLSVQKFIVFLKRRRDRQTDVIFINAHVQQHLTYMCDHKKVRRC